MTITTGSFPKMLKEGVYTIFGMTYNEKELQCKHLFDTSISTRKYEEAVLSSPMGLAPVKPEGASIKYDNMEQGYTNRATNVTYGLGFIITEEEMDDNQYPAHLQSMVNTRAGALAKSMRTTKEIVGANLYNRAFNSSYTFGDGKEMIATDHPTKAGTISNEVATTALSEASLENALIAIRGYEDDRGKLIAAKGDKLIVPRQLKYVADKILRSAMSTTVVTQGTDGVSNTNKINSLQNELAPYTNDYLSSSTAWYIRTDVAGMVNYERKALAFSEDNEFDTNNQKFKATERYVFTNDDPRAIYGSAGA